MLDVLLLRIQGPLMSFGAPMVDQRGVIQDYPALSMMTGLLGNALGYSHGDADALSGLQDRLRYAVRCDREGRRITDFHTVDLGQDFLRGAGWTTAGKREDRQGGSAKTGTHIRHRQYLADAAYTVAVTLVPADPEPDLAAVEAALQEPARPLFLGRKCCLPARPLLVGRLETKSLVAALDEHPRWIAQGDDRTSLQPLRAWWPADNDDVEPRTRVLPVTDERDWRNQIVVGRRLIREGTVNPPEVADGR
jgi:CRISPR system Cascade subunit CasD